MVERTKQHKTIYNYTYKQMMSDIISITVLIKDYKLKNIYAIPRGGLIPGVILSHWFNLPLLKNGMKINGQTLIVDDICDTGNTLSSSKYRRNVKVCLVGKPKGMNRLKAVIAPTLVGDNEWVKFWWEV